MNRFKKYRLRHQKEFICLICKNKFLRFYKRKGTFCSINCQIVFLKQNKLSEDHKQKIGIGLKNSLKYREALKVRTYPKNSGQFGNGRSSVGSNHANWKGGITPINEKIRKSLEYEEWRKRVFERDLYTCQKCKKVGGYLEADHIKPFSLYPELRLNINNGRTLCHDCHTETETYGWRLRWKTRVL